MTIAIGRYHIGPVIPEWITAWEELRKPLTPDGKPDWVTYNTMRQVVHTARNSIIKSALEQRPDITHVFFIDDDVCVPPDGLMRLLSHNAPVVTGLYIQRADPMMPVIYRRNAQGQHVHITKFCDGLQEIDACGAGCLLVRADVLRAIEATGEPWFNWPASGLSEDLAFCERVKALGYPILLDFDVKCTHLGILEVTYDMFAELSKDIKYSTDEIAQLSQEVRPYEHHV